MCIAGMCFWLCHVCVQAGFNGSRGLGKRKNAVPTRSILLSGTREDVGLLPKSVFPSFHYVTGWHVGREVKVFVFLISTIFG